MRGFTLVEILVATVIMSIIMAALFMTLSVGQRSWFSGDAAIELRDQAARAIMTMDKELSVTATKGINEISLKNVNDTSNTITFHLPQDNNADGSVVDANGNIEWSGPIIYSLNASNQIIRTFGGRTSVLANNIVTLQFRRTADRIIQVDITAQKTPRTGQQIQDKDQAIINMRN